MASVRHLGKGSQPPIIQNRLVLYSNVICPFAQRATLIMNAKKVPYQTVYMDLWSKAEWYKKKNPTGKVPALAFPESEKKEPVIESHIIADYLDEKYPENPLHPKDPYQKARDRGFVERFSDVINVLPKMMYENVEEENVQIFADELFNVLDPYETELRNRGSIFFGGAKPGMLDYMIWPWFERMIYLPQVDSRFGLDEKRFKQIISWLELMCNDDAVKTCFLSPEFYLKFTSGLKSKTTSPTLLDEAAEQREKNRVSK